MGLHAIHVVDLSSMCWHDTEGSCAKSCPLPDPSHAKKKKFFGASIAFVAQEVVWCRQEGEACQVLRSVHPDVHHVGSGTKIYWNIDLDPPGFSS